jgi:hypothetical protein
MRPGHRARETSHAGEVLQVLGAHRAHRHRRVVDRRLHHVDCTRRQTLTTDERALLFVYCSDHVVAQCLSCGLSFRMTELAADPLGGGHTVLCPRCRKDLTENARAHVYGCAMLPSEVRLRAKTVREAAQHLMKQSRELRDASDVLVREAEVVLFESQQALRAAMRNRKAPSRE